MKTFIAVQAIALVAVAGAYADPVTFVDNLPGAFLDISSTGTAITAVGDDSEHLIDTTVGNAAFPATNQVCIGNNGVLMAGVTAVCSVGFTNAAIGAGSAVPAGITPTTALGYLLPFWDDLDPAPEPSNTTLYWQEIGDTLYVQWNNDGHFSWAVGDGTVTFQVQVFSSGPILAQFLYPDPAFGGSDAAFDNGLSATIGYVDGANAFADANAQWSFNTASIMSGTVLSLVPEPASFGLLAIGGLALLRRRR
ncbi:MAG TPA: PEP-CTERM sorting domain-containing protein [Phycisphaerae bacterium]|jgi:hypothetical protein